MKKLFFILTLCAFAFSGISCGGGDSDKEGKKKKKNKGDSEYIGEPNNPANYDRDYPSERMNSQDAESILEQFLREMNAECPEEIEKGLALYGFQDNGSEVEIVFAYDDTTFSTNDLEMNKGQLKDVIMSSIFSTPDFKVLLDLLSQLNKGLVFNFVAAQSGASTQVRIPASQLR